MQTIESIKARLKAIDGKDYAAYQSLIGVYEYHRFKLFIDQIPKDPYAPPHTGVYRARVSFDHVFTPTGMRDSKIREIAFRDYLARRFFAASNKIAKGRRGTGHSGLITIDEPGQAILARSAVVPSDNYVEIRFFLGLPAAGRRVKSEDAGQMILEELPRIIEHALYKESMDERSMHEHIETAEDAASLRSQLEPLGMVAFISNGAILARKSGNSDLPLGKDLAVPFQSPETLQVTIDLPHAGRVTGMGIPKGITLIVGGGYHGKSTLLQAIELGIYNHIPGDGREKCAADSEAAKIRSYSGRYVEKVDISGFIKNLPAQKNTSAFSTENASGSTSQAANIQEAIESGAKVLLMDEDTCATNFMIRDEKMQKLVLKADEPITTFIDKTQQLFSESNISTILVLGGIGDYFDVSDKIIQMVRYIPSDVTKRAKEIARTSPVKRESEDEGSLTGPAERIPVPGSISPHNRYRKKSFHAVEVHRIHFGQTIIDLTDLEQLIELSQTKAIMHAINCVDKYIDGKRTLKEILDLLALDMEKEGLDMLSERISGNLSELRILELAGAINRLRGMKMSQKNAAH